MRRRLAVAAAVVALGLGVAACGGGGSSDKPSAPAAPAANVDPSSNNVITGPINRAKTVASQQEQRDATVDSAVPDN